ncbi:hypothetical protein ACTMTJ_44625 [Phytohabitans sp. LJ34]|uniref:hypothetical protein n=1 Tax=Phytohabitans sp. LJ34 TaxID=3452217 RepID=UPI003F8A92DB
MPPPAPASQLRPAPPRVASPRAPKRGDAERRHGSPVTTLGGSVAALAPALQDAVRNAAVVSMAMRTSRPETPEQAPTTASALAGPAPAVSG